MNRLKTLLLGAAMIAAAPAFAQTMTREQYIERFAPIAIEHAEKYGIPASIKMAQGLLESNNGNGRLARVGNAHFGIKVKASDRWQGRVVYHDDDRPQEPFRAYDSPEESWTDHSEYLDRQVRYDSLFRYGNTDYRSWARGLKNCGYATDPKYAPKLIKIIEDNQLWRLDRGMPRVGSLTSGAVVGVGIDPNLPHITIDPDKYVIELKKHGKRNRP